MTEKMKNKFKKDIACLLAFLQVVVVVGCSQKRSSEEKSNETLETIEELNELEKVDIEEGVLTNSDVKNSLTKLNNYLQNYQNVKYNVIDAFLGTDQINYYSDDFLRGKVSFSNDLVTVICCHEDYSESTTVRLYSREVYPDLTNETEYTVNSKSWIFNNAEYVLSETTYSDDNTFRKDIQKKEDGTSLLVTLKRTNDKYYIDIQQYVWLDDNMTVTGFYSYEINKDDFQMMSDLLDNYKNSNELNDIVDYMKDVVLNTLENKITEEEYAKLKETFKNENTLVLDK